MAFVFYPAIIEKGEIEYGVYFPDLPGCTSGGDTQNDAANNAEEALALHIEGMLEDSEVLPQPSKLEDIKTEENEALVLVKAVISEEKVRVNVMLPASLLQAIDAKTNNRSEFLTQAARKALVA